MKNKKNMSDYKFRIKKLREYSEKIHEYFMNMWRDTQPNSNVAMAYEIKHYFEELWNDIE